MVDLAPVREVLDRFKSLDSEALAQEGPDSPAALINGFTDALLGTAAELRRIAALRREPLGPDTHSLDLEHSAVMSRLFDALDRTGAELKRTQGEDGQEPSPEPR